MTDSVRTGRPEETIAELSVKCAACHGRLLYMRSIILFWMSIPTTNIRSANISVLADGRFSRFALALLLTFLSGIPSTVQAGDCPTSSRWQRLTDPLIGFSICYPAEWSDGGQVIATQFAAGAQCRSVRVIDFAPPPDSGATAVTEQSLVQVCAKPLEPEDSLHQYMRRTYGEALQNTFAITDLDGVPGYQSTGRGQTRTIFTQYRNSLIQIVATVAASPDKAPERQAQVEQILESFALH